MNKIRRFMLAFVMIAGTSFLTAPAAQAYTNAVCEPANNHTVLSWTVYTFGHGADAYDVATCFMKQTTVGQDYFWLKFMFDDGSGQLRNQHNAATRIEVEKMNFDDRSGASGFLSNCDQTNDWPGNSADGRGCDKGNYAADGPCWGFRAIDNSPKAYGIHGCSTTDSDGVAKYTDFSLVDKVNGRETGTGTCDGTVVFYVKWDDTTVTGPITLTPSGPC